MNEQEAEKRLKQVVQSMELAILAGANPKDIVEEYMLKVFPELKENQLEKVLESTLT